jgi:hypothetical protein
MVTYEDCLGLCELSADEVAAIARHVHLPEIVALEMGAHLARSPHGRQTIRRMILDDIAAARQRGDHPEAALLDLVLRELDVERGTDETLEQRVQALGRDPATARRVRQRVQTYLALMGRTYGLEVESLRERSPLELLAAEMRCAACAETARCRRFLAGGADEPGEFCPNAAWLKSLARQEPRPSPLLPASGSSVSLSWQHQERPVEDDEARESRDPGGGREI